MYWVCSDGEDAIYVKADRWYDAREAARQALGIPTYDGLSVVPSISQADDHPTYIDVSYIGSAYNNTLERIVTRVG